MAPHKSGSFKSRACIPPVSRTAKLFRNLPCRRIWRKMFGARLPEISMQNREASGTSNTGRPRNRCYDIIANPSNFRGTASQQGLFTGSLRPLMPTRCAQARGQFDLHRIPKIASDQVFIWQEQARRESITEQENSFIYLFISRQD